MLSEKLPYKLEEKYNCLVVNNSYVSYWYIKTYLNGSQMLSTLNTIINDPNTILCFNVRRLNSGEFLKRLNNKLAVFKSERSKNGNEQLDIDILEKFVSDARNIRYIIQVENEDIFEVSTIIRMSSNSEKRLESEENLFRNKLYSEGVSIYPMNFNEYESYKQFYPTLIKVNAIHDKTCKIFTTSSFASLFPFYSQNVIESGGLYIGNFRTKTCILDFRKNEVENRNILILGSSGTGKSFLVKNMILQYLYNGIKQIVIDPEGEYIQIAKMFGQRVITKETFNIMEIEEQFAKNYPHEYMYKKINIISNIIELDKILDSNEKIIKVKDKIQEVYNEFKITENIDSLYRQENDENVYVRKKYIDKSKFPTISGLKSKIKDIRLSRLEKQNLLKQIEKYECTIDCDYNEDLIVYNLNQNNHRYIMSIMYKLQEYLSPDYIIYMDEMWKLMCNNSISLEIVNLFKTIRKRGTSIVAITQDISDIVTYDNGNFGKSIFNNAYTKIFFRTEYLDLENLQRIVSNTENFYEKVMSLKRGSALLEQRGMLLELDIAAFPQDKEIIEGGKI